LKAAEDSTPKTIATGHEPAEGALTDGRNIEAALLLMERLRGDIDDALLDLALSPLRERLDALRRGELPEQRLKQVTVMFCDVVGSTALGHALDPEEINVVMDTALERYTTIIERWGGRVLQYTGDGMLAAFGTVGVREDDAERAVLAGLGIVAETVVHTERVRLRHGRAGFNVRVGLHTGPVLLGGGVDGENTIRGTTVNLAARMEQNAPPGTLRVSADTWRLCSGAFQAVEQPALVVKGRAEPVRTWLVERRRPRHEVISQRGVGGRRAPLVGREAELQALQQAWHRLHGGGTACEVVTLMGEAGLGKSRLEQVWEEWTNAQPQPVLWLRARCQPQTQQQPYGLLRDLLADGLDLPDADTPAQARERFTAAVVPLFQADEGEPNAHLLGQLLGLNFADSPHVRGHLGSGGQMRTLAWHAAAEILRRLALRRARPLLLRLEDLHWADTSSLQFLRHLAALPLGTPIGVLALARPTLDEQDALWQGIEQRRIVLQPLSAGQRADLADALLAPLPEVPPALRALVIDRADGNPFYMEELVQMLLDRGALVADVAAEPAAAAGLPGATGEALRWRFVAERFDRDRLPPTLTGVLQARLDLLPPPQRRALQQAAVLGLVFSNQPLHALDSAALTELDALVRRGLLLPQAQDALEHDDKFAFSHQLLHQVVYESLLKRDRREAHARAARWYAALQTARAAGHLGTAADHFERAELGQDAAHYSLLAAEDLAERFAHEAVIEQATRGLRLATEDDHARRWRLLLARQRALRHAGRNDAQWLDLDALDRVAERTDEPLHHATVAVRRTVALDESGDARRAAELAPGALALARAAADDELELTAYSAWAGALRSTGAHAEAERVAAEALQRARAAGLRWHESELLIGLAAVATERGDSALAERLARQALAIDRELRNRVGECIGLINLGANALQRGDFAQAQADLEEAMALSRAIGRRTFEVSIQLNLSAVALARGLAVEAEAAAAAGAALATLIGNREYQAFADLSRSAALLELGRLQEADTGFERARDGLMALDQPHLAIEAVAGLVRVALARGDAVAAVALAETVFAHWQAQGHFNGCERPLVICLACHDVLAAAGDARSEAVLRYAWDELCVQANRLGAGLPRDTFLDAHAAHRRLRTLAADRSLAPL
jgi:class 3 adenylate cyclase/predicted ATPase